MLSFQGDLRLIRIIFFGFVVSVSMTLADAFAQDTTKVKQDSVKVQPNKLQHFEPIPDRWRDIKPPPYELNVEGKWYDPYNQNILKGDYPIIGQDVFFVLTATADNLFEYSRVPTPSGISTFQPQSEDFFGRGERSFISEFAKITLELYKGDAAFRPRDWELKATTVFNLNYINNRENNNVNINVRKGDNRTDSHIALSIRLSEVISLRLPPIDMI